MFRCLGNVVLLVAAWCCKIDAYRIQFDEVLNNSVDLKHNIVLVGNPGVGKSTILNGLMGKDASQFASGVSFGKGMTYKLDVTEHEGVRYMDTPGLADQSLRKEAAQAIQEAMRMGGRFKIIFVVYLQAGRVSPQDVTTMKTVLEALPDVGNDQYAIIVNKLKPSTIKRLKKNDGEGKKLVHASLMQSLPKTTVMINWNPYIEALDDEDDVKWEIDPVLKAWIDSLEEVEIIPEHVQDVNYEDYDKQMKLMEEMLDQLRNDAELQRKENARLQQQLMDSHARMEKQQNDWQQKLEERQKKMDKELADYRASEERKLSMMKQQNAEQRKRYAEAQAMYRRKEARMQRESESLRQRAMERTTESK